MASKYASDCRFKGGCVGLSGSLHLAEGLIHGDIKATRVLPNNVRGLLLVQIPMKI